MLPGEMLLIQMYSVHCTQSFLHLGLIIFKIHFVFAGISELPADRLFQCSTWIQLRITCIIYCHLTSQDFKKNLIYAHETASSSESGSMLTVL